jgi:hypothetical protein
MSPLFHRDGDGSGGQEPGPGHLPSLYELGPRLDEVVNNVAALPPEQFAAQLMTRYFTAGWPVASQITSMVAADTICWDLLTDNSGEHAAEPIPDAFFALQDLVTEALQLLQTAGLVMQRSYKVNQDHAYSQWLRGLVTTPARAGGASRWHRRADPRPDRWSHDSGLARMDDGGHGADQPSESLDGPGFAGDVDAGV